MLVPVYAGARKPARRGTGDSDRRDAGTVQPGGGGLHHYAYEVADIRALQTSLAARDMPMLQAEPVKGAGNFLCNFLSPVVTRGVLVEYVQVLAG